LYILKNKVLAVAWFSLLELIGHDQTSRRQKSPARLQPAATGWRTNGMLALIGSFFNAPPGYRPKTFL
jgi:hypothetical protein